jgi:glutamine cyclotransferase
MIRIRYLPAIFLILPLLTNCCGKKVQSGQERKDAVAARRPVVRGGTELVSPTDGRQFTSGDLIPFELKRISDTVPPIDSVEFYFRAYKVFSGLAEPFRYDHKDTGNRVGSAPLRAVIHYRDGRKEYHNASSIIRSDLEPRLLNYRILNTWPHDRRAYTQGLVYEDGYLYEGTGQWRESSLRKTLIRTGEPVRMMNLPDDVFGEGITIFKDRIFQLTYKSQVGFVYDKESFRRIQKVYYENREGWGLTHDGENLIMSDGTHRIYYMDPEYFTEVRQLEVFDNQGPVSSLNELEYIEGKIFANLYGQELIVIIDPGSGKVTGKLNMKGILPPEDRHRGIDVFNGIAWNPGERILYVTGKYWPKLFEISLPDGFHN